MHQNVKVWGEKIIGEHDVKKRQTKGKLQTIAIMFWRGGSQITRPMPGVRAKICQAP